jgi:hypothetical protein
MKAPPAGNDCCRTKEAGRNRNDDFDKFRSNVQLSRVFVSSSRQALETSLTDSTTKARISTVNARHLK